jgi:hypothetical protein
LIDELHRRGRRSARRTRGGAWLFATATPFLGLIGATGALAADLPSRAAAPAESGLAVCTVGGMAGFVVPGSTVCLRVGGYATAEFSTGNLSKQYGLQFVGAPGSSAVTSAVLTPTSQRDSIGYAARGQIDFDARQNTEYGVLRSYVEVLYTYGNGFESPGNSGALNLGFVEFAGLTAGKDGSFFSYLAGGPSWYDFYSPDRYNGNQPELIAYTATFGPASATLSLEEPTGAQVNGPIDGGFANAYYGIRVPDVVGALRVESGWGSAQLSGVAHNTHVLGVSGDSLNVWGGAALVGATYNLPQIAQGDKVAGQVVYSHAALGYSGLSNTAWSPYDQGLNINGNGTIFQLTDALDYDTGLWSLPTTWSFAGFFEHHFTQQVSLSPQVSYGVVSYSGSPGMISTHAASFMAGGTVHYIPVPHLDFQLGVMFQSTVETTPASYVGPEPFHSRANGVATSFQIVRDF